MERVEVGGVTPFDSDPARSTVRLKGECDGRASNGYSMSLRAMLWVFENSSYALGARLVHLALADKANDDHDYELWMYQAKIAERAKLSVKQVGRILAQMEADGAIELLEQGGGRGKPSRYRLVIELGQIVQVSDSETRTFPTVNADIDDVETRTSMESVLVVTQRKELKKNSKRATFDDDFDALWKLYPRKVNKSAALRAYTATRRKGDSAEGLLQATANYAKSRGGEDPAYTMHGSTFFGPSERWRDWLDGGAAQLESVGPKPTKPLTAIERRRAEQAAANQRFAQRMIQQKEPERLALATQGGNR